MSGFASLKRIPTTDRKNHCEKAFHDANEQPTVEWCVFVPELALKCLLVD
ncbi:hypothetical protein [Tunturiibacter psychrotolerans]|jgi:hypothetical protein